MIFSKKSLGQNFLIDKNIIKKIVELIKIENRNILEIGPGTGSLTNEILKRKPKSLQLIEKDNKLSKLLEKEYKEKKIVKLFNSDILTFNLESNLKKDTIVFGNLPYNISSQILVKFLKFQNWPPNYSDLILMFQKELGQKIIGKYKSTNYGRLSILTNYRLFVYNKFLISANSFAPKPKVTSMILHLKPKKKLLFNLKDIKNLEKVTNIIFSNKRKMINKSIKKILNEEQMKKLLDLRMDLRPANIKPEIFYKIASIIETDY